MTSQKPLLGLRIILAATLWAGADAWSGEVPAAASGSLQVLFLGNSYTYANDLPGTLTAVARSLGDNVAADAFAKGAYRLMDHARDERSLAKIKARSWNFVVLQEQSQFPGFEDSQIDTDVAPYAVRLDELIHAANPLGLDPVVARILQKAAQESVLGPASRGKR